ncbi:hypothetical protein G3580_13040 [Nitrogeniibacter mangrovi]|uniref:Uncharacterized protein n=1 Tax=Nitrogeniibacter mangrovi TaxID=2016596 RepID=A0A6C1B8A8_9RHOO|nr:hypothetical protein [Nitrogeniibacter mangrovi]QID18474.1 hypothetical protein G3580_13040 [Nitrogeniibacter mangrovi]
MSAPANVVLDALPMPDGRGYRALSPGWFVAILRIVSVGFAVLTAWVAAGHWHTMPVWAQVLVGVLVPAFLLMGLHPRGWAQYATKPFLQADRRGLYLPSLTSSTLGRPAVSRWLFLPWAHVSGLRLARVMTDEGASPCVACDVVARAEQIDEFFLGTPLKADVTADGRVPVAVYIQVLPRPKEVLARLEALSM